MSEHTAVGHALAAHHKIGVFVQWLTFAEGFAPGHEVGIIELTGLTAVK